MSKNTRPTPRLYNLTPHGVTLIRDGHPITIPPSGQVARVSIERQIIATLRVGGLDIPVEAPIFGPITGLPEPRDGVLYIASRTVVDRARRADVVRVEGKLRDGNDRIVGAGHLATFPVIR
jgi:hypothetical protein